MFVLSKLKTIDLRVNKVTIPSQYNVDSKIWPQLNTLQLGYNKIQDINPLLHIIDENETNSTIFVLDFGNNQLHTFPDAIITNKWISLKVLDLSNNQLKRIPPQVGLLPNIQSLLLQGNVLRSMQRIIQKNDTKELILWLKNRVV